MVGLDLGGSTITAWAAGPSGVLGAVGAPLVVHRPDDHTAEIDPVQTWERCRSALAAVVTGVVEALGPQDWAGVTVSSLRQGFVLLGRDGVELGPAVLNSDRRGAPQLDRLRAVDGLQRLTGHWVAPELTLPKLLQVAADDPDLWAGTSRLLFIHDWLLWMLSGEQVSGVDYVCAGQCADVAARGWATGLLDDLALGTGWCAPVVEAGLVIGGLTDPTLGLPLGLPVVAGAGDTQLAAMGSGGLADGVVTVVAGSSTPVIAATSAALLGADAWTSTHARADLWAAETNCGYPGAMAGWAQQIGVAAQPSGRPGAGGVLALTGTPQWSERAWSHRPPMTLVGVSPSTPAADVAQAFAEANAFCVRGNLEQLEAALGRPAGRLVLTGGGAARIASLVATVCGRALDLVVGSGDATAAAGRALVSGVPVAAPATRTVQPGDESADYDAPYRRWVEAYLAALV